MYFDQFPQLLYTFDPNLIEFKQVVDIFVRVRMLDSIINNISVYYTYPVKDSDTPESIAAKYYNDPTRHWIILFTNQILDPYFDWPLSQDNLQQNLIDQYGSVVNAQATLDHIEKQTTVTVTQNGTTVSNTYISYIDTNVVAVDGSTTLPTIGNPVLFISSTSVNFPNGAVVNTAIQLVAVNAYDNANEANEDKRNIKLIKADYVSQIESELTNLLSQ